MSLVVNCSAPRRMPYGAAMAYVLEKPCALELGRQDRVRSVGAAVGQGVESIAHGAGACTAVQCQPPL